MTRGKTAAYDKIRSIITPILEPLDLYYARKREYSDPSCFHRNIDTKLSWWHKPQSQKLICIIQQFLAVPFPLTGKMEEKITWAPAFFTCTPRLCNLSWFCPGLGLQCHSCSQQRQQWRAICDLGNVWHPLSITTASAPQAQHLSQPRQGSTWTPQCPLTESPTASTPRFFLLYPLRAACTVCLCSPCLWVSVAVKASDLALVMMLEAEDWRTVLILWLVRV